jgi:recombination protein RecR
MQYLTKSINALIECFKNLPGIGEKTAERLAFTMINFDKDKLDTFAKAITNVKEKIKRCKICNNITEKDICDICDDESREKSLLCVVEEPKNIFLFEKNEIFSGKYHVLDGLISPINNIRPEDINITSLIKRVKEENIKEIVIALKPSLEGEATAQYISKMVNNPNVKVTKLAHGVPMGVDMDYLDPLTLEMALSNRKEVS